MDIAVPYRSKGLRRIVREHVIGHELGGSARARAGTYEDQTARTSASPDCGQSQRARNA